MALLISGEIFNSSNVFIYFFGLCALAGYWLGTSSMERVQRKE